MFGHGIARTFEAGLRQSEVELKRKLAIGLLSIGARKGLTAVLAIVLFCMSAKSADEPGQFPPLPALSESSIGEPAANLPESSEAEPFPAIPELPELESVTNPESAPATPPGSTFLSRETPLFARLRQALAMDQPTAGRISTGSGRFGLNGDVGYEADLEGPGMLDVVLPETTRRLRQRFTKSESDETPQDEGLPPTFLGRFNSLFFNHLLADPTLPFSIRNPGPDLVNFPNSAYTIERGHVYLETQPVQINGPTNSQAYNYSFGYLLRFGLTDRVEFRLFSNGITYQSAFRGNAGSGVGPIPAATGWSPLFIDFKVNFWEQRLRSLIPAMGLEVFMSTETGSQAFRTGVTYGINLLFDLNFAENWNLEWNIGVQPANANIPNLPDAVLPQLNAQWSLQRGITDNFAMFTHGYFNGAALPQFGGNSVVGLGAVYFLGDRWSVWGDYNVGLDKDRGPPFTYNIGFAFAY